MITKMKKLIFLVHNKEYEPFLEQLRSLGVVHVIKKQQGAIQDAELHNDINMLGRLRTLLRELSPLTKGSSNETSSLESVNAYSVLEEYDALMDEKAALETHSEQNLHHSYSQRQCKHYRVIGLKQIFH